MSERSQMIEWIRGELVGPSRGLTEPDVAQFSDREFIDSVPLRHGALVWCPVGDEESQEVLYFGEAPHRKYGAGLLHPAGADELVPTPDQVALAETDTSGVDQDQEQTVTSDSVGSEVVDDDYAEGTDYVELQAGTDSDDFSVTSPDVRRPSTIGVSFCVELEADGYINVALPRLKRFAWQNNDQTPFAVNGRYELCARKWIDKDNQPKSGPAWRRQGAVALNAAVQFQGEELIANRVIRRHAPVPDGSPLCLLLELFPRRLRGHEKTWLVTVVLRNDSSTATSIHETTLYQCFFEMTVIGGKFKKYPESERPFEDLDPEEQSLVLLHREAGVWGIGHGCAAGWDAGLGCSPTAIYADVMPAVQLPSMTPDIEENGERVRLSMRELAELRSEASEATWQSLQQLDSGYENWIKGQQEKANKLPPHLAAVAKRHLDACAACHRRIRSGLDLLRSDSRVLEAFRLANLAMMLQQIATKQLKHRSFAWNAARRQVAPVGDHQSPWEIYRQQTEDTSAVGFWRAFQIAFFLMSLSGTSDEESVEREIVDLIWFPTGGGKTEAYLAVAAFYMFHQRLCIEVETQTPYRDGTNVLMRYTLRMLTTQQFQRAASLVCAMEYLRRNSSKLNIEGIPGRSFSLGLWIGGQGSPNKIADARMELAKFRRGEIEGNPLVLTECPWCRSEIGEYKGARPKGITPSQWHLYRVRGISDDRDDGPRLLCSDGGCAFGGEQKDSWLPIEVIDDRIYENPPSFVISTVDKLAMVAYKPEAGALFGRRISNGHYNQVCKPPGLIIQDELHLIAGPLGTMYALYEGVFERLCSVDINGTWIGPKIIASTATIRGAHDQVTALYARSDTRLFPSPALSMGDTFFGRYARDEQEEVRPGRLYLGIHASNYGSVLTTQVRTFSSALFRPWAFPPERRDPWWTLLAFYNSIRELSGAKTLFDSDIPSRLKFIFNREGFSFDDRRRLMPSEELTSRLSQAEIVRMMDRLSVPYADNSFKAVDACLASNIIEVGVDIDRLSLMGVVGQPKTTATYIQVTGRIGRRWWERPGLVLTIYNPSKSRDRSHFEQFHSYHRRLYERVEPTTATPFALSAIQRGLPGVLIAWARQHSDAAVNNVASYRESLALGRQLLRERCKTVQQDENDRTRSLAELDRVYDEIIRKWEQNPQTWSEFPPKPEGEYLMLWPGQYATALQKQQSVVVASSMRQVDRQAELFITPGYVAAIPLAAPSNDS